MIRHSSPTMLNPMRSVVRRGGGPKGPKSIKGFEAFAAPRRLLVPSTFCSYNGASSYSTSAPTPPDQPAPTLPLLATLKADLKTAMRAKDAPRLRVLRSVLAAVTNASKTATPVSTQPQLVALLLKQRATSTATATEFRAAGREDLVSKEEDEIAVLTEYVGSSGIQVVEGQALAQLVEGAVKDEQGVGEVRKAAQLKGLVMKRLLGKGGLLDGKAVDKDELASIVAEKVGA